MPGAASALRFSVFTAHSDDYSTGALCARVNAAYCKRHGYAWQQFVSTRQELMQAVGVHGAPMWIKVKLLVDLLTHALAEASDANEKHYLVWIDADACFIDFERSLEDVVDIGGHRELIISEDINFGSLINTGVMLSLVSPWSLALWQEVWDLTRVKNGRTRHYDEPFFEQTALTRVLTMRRVISEYYDSFRLHGRPVHLPGVDSSAGYGQSPDACTADAESARSIDTSGVADCSETAAAPSVSAGVVVHGGTPDSASAERALEGGRSRIYAGGWADRPKLNRGEMLTFWHSYRFAENVRPSQQRRFGVKLFRMVAVLPKHTMNSNVLDHELIEASGGATYGRHGSRYYDRRAELVFHAAGVNAKGTKLALITQMLHSRGLGELVSAGCRLRMAHVAPAKAPAAASTAEPAAAAASSTSSTARARAAASIEEAVTVVMTTSPSRSDPDLSMLRATFASLALAGLQGCRQILVCDHFEVGATRRGKDHGGRLPQEQIDRYRQRLDAFRSAAWAAHVEVLELEHWHGFGLACRAALERVSSPLVFVVQHDMAFRRPVELRPLVRLLQTAGSEREPLNFVCLLKTTTVKYRERVRSRHKLDVGAPVAFVPPGPPADEGAGPPAPVPLTRLPQFFDCMHLARREWYRALFSRPLLNGAAIGERTRGEFTENNLGLHMLQLATARPERDEGGDASAGVLAVCAEFGGWLYDDGGPSMVMHLDGRKFLSAVEREARGIPPDDFRYRLCDCT